MVATEDDRDRAGRGHLANLAIDHRVGPLDVRRDDVRVAGVDHGHDVERIDVELERMDRARRVLRLPDGARPEPGARAAPGTPVQLPSSLALAAVNSSSLSAPC